MHSSSAWPEEIMHQTLVTYVHQVVLKLYLKFEEMVHLLGALISKVCTRRPEYTPRVQSAPLVSIIAYYGYVGCSLCHDFYIRSLRVLEFILVCNELTQCLMDPNGQPKFTCIRKHTYQSNWCKV